MRHACWLELTADEAKAALAELRELAAGRGDLLAQAARIFLGQEAPRAERAQGAGPLGK